MFRRCVGAMMVSVVLAGGWPAAGLAGDPASPTWRTAEQAKALAEPKGTGLVFYVSDGQPATWSKAVAEQSAQVPFVELTGPAAADLAKACALDRLPALVLADSFGNPVEVWMGKLDNARLQAELARRIAALPAIQQRVSAKLKVDVPEAQAQAGKLLSPAATSGGPRQLPAVTKVLRPLVEDLLCMTALKGYPDLATPRALLDELQAAGRQRLNAALADLRAGGELPPARIKLADLAATFKGTPVGAEAQVALNKLVPQVKLFSVSTGGAAAAAAGDGPQPDRVAWIAIQTEQAYVSDVTPVVAEGVSAFDPTISTVGTGTVMEVRNPIVTWYRVELAVNRFLRR